MKMNTIVELVEYVESLRSRTVRGMTVIDSQVTLEGDYSGRITLSIDPVGATLVEAILDDGDLTELVWHFDDVRFITPDDECWEYWDEFDNRMNIQ